MTATDGRTVSITARGYQQLAAELEHLQTTGRQQVADLLREVREDGDLPDNPGLLDVLEQQAQLEHRIGLLSEQLSSAAIVEGNGDGSADVGSHVSVRDHDSGETSHYELVAEIESDAEHGRLSIEAPIGKALRGLRPGAHTSVETPRGMIRLELLSVSAVPEGVT